MDKDPVRNSWVEAAELLRIAAAVAKVKGSPEWVGLEEARKLITIRGNDINDAYWREKKNAMTPAQREAHWQECVQIIAAENAITR